MRIVTFNDQFGDGRTDLPRVNGGVVMVQEAKTVDVRNAVDTGEYNVAQRGFGKNDARAGSAMYWRQDRFAVKGKGQQLLAHADGNDDMLDRYVTWRDLKVKGQDVTVRMASAHRPPGDERDEWPEFDRNLAKFAAQAKKDGVPVVIGMDANFPREGRAAAIRRLENLTGLVWHAPKGSIDGFLTSPSVRFNTVPHRENDKFSDHEPVAASITVFEPKKKKNG